MTNEQSTELLALMADQIRATDRLTDLIDKQFTQLIETLDNGCGRRAAKFDQSAGHLTEVATDKEPRLVKLENETPSNAELHRRVLALEEQSRRAS